MLTFYHYQAFGIFVLFEMEIFQYGGYLADDIGLGKVIGFTSRCKNQLLIVSRKDVKEATSGRGSRTAYYEHTSCDFSRLP